MEHSYSALSILPQIGRYFRSFVRFAENCALNVFLSLSKIKIQTFLSLRLPPQQIYRRHIGASCQHNRLIHVECLRYTGREEKSLRMYVLLGWACYTMVTCDCIPYTSLGSYQLYYNDTYLSRVLLSKSGTGVFTRLFL